MSRRRIDGASGDVNSQPQPYPPPLMALMEAKVSHGNKQAQRHGEGREVSRGRGCAARNGARDGDLKEKGTSFVWWI